jgi:lipid-A-disaccharide synthase
LSASLLLSCGEPSGDLYAGALVRELRAIDPGVKVSGLGGPAFASAGGRLLEDYRDLAVTGLTGPLVGMPRYFSAWRRLVRFAQRERPDALVLIDFPDFNFFAGRSLHRLGIPVVYYISPQVWAWRPRRLATIRSFAARVLVIFPFEEAIYREGGVPVEFVGHPLVELARPALDRSTFLSRHGLSTGAPTVAILPGSRNNEVFHHLADLLRAASLIQRAVPGAQFVVARAPNLLAEPFDKVPLAGPSGTVVVEGEADTALAAADVVLTASGTATVQTALHDKPMVIVYRVSPLEFRLLRRLITVKMVGMVNLIAGELIVPELIQDAFTPEAVAREAISMLTDPGRVERIRAALSRVRGKLDGSGASRRAAEAILKVASPERRPTID